MLLAAEGGYQAFELGRAEWGWLIFAAITAVVAIFVGVVLSRGVMRADADRDGLVVSGDAVRGFDECLDELLGRPGARRVGGVSAPDDDPACRVDERGLHGSPPEVQPDVPPVGHART